VDVLIVDDDRAIQRMIADALTKRGFTVAVERDGDWAVKTFEKKRFDAVILDILLPAMDGYEVARRIRSLPGGADVPIILMSAIYKGPSQKRDAVEKHGAVAFLEKPLKLGDLYEALNLALKNQGPARPQTSAANPESDPDAGGEADPDAKEEITHVERVSTDARSPDSMQGQLGERSFAEVIAEIHRWKATGALLLRRDKVKKIVYFRSGVPVSVKSNLLSECLGQVMVRERMISQADCDESVRRMKATSRQQGTVLIEMGRISPHNLNHALVVQLQTKLFEVFAWESGDYQFNPKVMPPADPVNLYSSTAAIIYEGIRRSFDENRLDRVFGNVDSLYVHPSENPLFALQEAGLGDEEKALLMAADGHKTVATLRALRLLSPLDTGRFLFAMKCANVIDLKPKAASGKPKPSILKIAEEATDRASAPEPSSPPSPPKLPPRKSGEQRRATPAPLKTTEAVPPARPRTGRLLPELDTVIGQLSSDEQQTRDKLLRKVDELRRADYFGALGVAREASREDIKRAYFALAKEYHPDKHFGSASAEVRQLASQVYALITQAHDTLTDSDERKRYLAELDRGVKRDIAGPEVGKILAAEGKFQKGEELLAQRNFREAHKFFQEAIDLYPDEGEFHAYLGWSLFQSNPHDSRAVEEALRSLETAVMLNPKVDKSYLFTGFIHKTTGRPDKAEKHFEKAIQCNPDCTEALRELRLLGKTKR